MRNRILKIEEAYRRIRQRCDSHLWADLIEMRNHMGEMAKLARGQNDHR